MLGVVVVYLGQIAAFLGGVSLLRPLSFVFCDSHPPKSRASPGGEFHRSRDGWISPGQGGYAPPRRAHSLTSLRPCTSSASSTPSGSRPQKNGCIAP